MDISSSSIKRFWSDHGRNIKRYGFFVLLLIAGWKTSDYVSTWIALAGLFCIYAYDRWGSYWEEAGRQVLYPQKIAKEQAERAQRVEEELNKAKKEQEQ
jgi:hypothetical protein